jgi:hypothetical protein
VETPGRKQLTLSKMKNMNTQKMGLLTTALCGIVTLGLVSAAQANEVLNGNFATYTTSSSTGSGQIGYNTTVAGWANTGASTGINNYNFVFLNAANAVSPTLGGIGQYSGVLSFYSVPTANAPTGTFAALDADASYSGAIGQTIGTGGGSAPLIPGDTYSVAFTWAGVQQTGYSGNTTNFVAVTLGGQTLDTPTQITPSTSSVGWFSSTLNFTATSSSELLSFLAVGQPINNEPPFVLLSGVDVELVPNTPDGGLTVALLGGALVGLEGLRRKFLRK